MDLSQFAGLPFGQRALVVGALTSLPMLFSGVVFLSAVGIVLAPVFHRVVHAFHIDDDSS